MCYISCILFCIYIYIYIYILILHLVFNIFRTPRRQFHICSQNICRNNVATLVLFSCFSSTSFECAQTGTLAPSETSCSLLWLLLAPWWIFWIHCVSHTPLSFLDWLYNLLTSFQRHQRQSGWRVCLFLLFCYCNKWAFKILSVSSVVYVDKCGL